MGGGNGVLYLQPVVLSSYQEGRGNIDGEEGVGRRGWGGRGEEEGMGRKGWGGMGCCISCL